MDVPKHTLKFGKDYKLRHRTLVNGLFTEGKGAFGYPLRMVWRLMTHEELTASFRDMLPAGVGRLQIMVTVPKKKRRHAVDRVLMRRRIREAFRLNRKPLEEALDRLPGHPYLQLAFIYVHSDNAPYQRVEVKMKTLLDTLARQISQPRCLCQDSEA